MSRQPRAGGRYIQPIDSTGALVAPEAPKGVYTLTALGTYYYVLGGADAPFLTVHLTSLDAAMVITSAAVQDCDHGELEASNFSTTGGDWIGEDPTTAFVGTEGTGWTQSNGVVASAGSAVGGALIHVAETGAARTRLTVVVGATGGRLRVSSHGKD